MARRVSLILAILAVMACSPWSSPPGGVTLTITGGGQVSCPTPYGCRPSLVIQADPTRRSPEPVWTVKSGEEISFPSVMTASWSTWDVGSAPIDPPATIQPGRYRLAGVVNLDSDVISPVPSPGPTEIVPTCLGEVIVSADLLSVLIDVRFDGPGGCTIGTGVGID